MSQFKLHGTYMTDNSNRKVATIRGNSLVKIRVKHQKTQSLLKKVF